MVSDDRTPNEVRRKANPHVRMSTWAATLLAAGVFALDLLSHLEAAVSILYLVAIAAGGFGRSAARIKSWTTGCLLLAIASFIATHLGSADEGSVFRLIFSATGMLVVAALLLVMRELSVSRFELEFRQREITRLNQSLKSAVRLRTDQLSQSELRFSSLFRDLNIACAEQMVAEAHLMVGAAQSEGIRDVEAWSALAPHQLSRCRAALRFTMANEPLMTLIGCNDRDTLLALPLHAWIENADQLLDAQITAMFAGQHHVAMTVTIIDKSGAKMPVALNLNALSDWSASFTTFTDLSEQQRAHDIVLAAQDRLARANRAASIGAISTSLIHELNQPILSMALEARNGLRWLDRQPPDVAAAGKALERLSRTADRMGAIVARTRQQVISRKRSIATIDLVHLIEETRALLSRDLAARGAAAELKFDVSRALVRADANELQQVLINLILNAADAMGEMNTPRKLAISVVEAEQRRFAVEVSDTGPGITEADPEALFKPFYTTKPDGMGIGLQICRSIVESFGGVISASNRPGGGAAFRFVLPAAST